MRKDIDMCCFKSLEGTSSVGLAVLMSTDDRTWRKEQLVEHAQLGNQPFAQLSSPHGRTALRISELTFV